MISRWGGIPRSVLQQTGGGHQYLLEQALDYCRLNEVSSSMKILNDASKSGHRLLHLTVLDGYLDGPVVFASDWVEGELLSRFLQEAGSVRCMNFWQPPVAKRPS